MPEHQGPRRHAVVDIIVNGKQITSVLHPYLISVQVIDNWVEHDQCNIELDDRNAELQLPPDGVPLQVTMGWAGEGPRLPDRGRESEAGGQGPLPQTGRLAGQEGELPWGGPGMELVFDGVVSSVESGFGRRGGGRRVWIEATSGNVQGEAKTPQNDSLGEGNVDDEAASSKNSGKSGSGGAGGGAKRTGGAGGGVGQGEIPLMEMMQKVFGPTGLKVKLSPEMMKLKRGYWYINGSPQDFGTAIAKETGGIFKIAGGVATLVGRNEGVNADGDPMPLVEAIWGINLIGWRIKPYTGRPQWGSAAARAFDIHNASWDMFQSKIGGKTPFGGTQAVAHYLQPVADGGVAGQVNQGNTKESESRRGTGWILLNGEPLCKSGGKILIDLARPGVDGTYFIKEVEHNYQRGVGFTTRCNVESPTVKPGGIGWTNDPGEFVPGVTDAEVPEQSTDPMAPGYVPKPPTSGPTVFTEEEKDRMRQWYIDNGQPLPNSLNDLTKPGYEPRPPRSGPTTWTPEEIERMRKAMLEALERDLSDITNNFGGGAPINEGYVPGQAGEGGITFPE